MPLTRAFSLNRHNLRTLGPLLFMPMSHDHVRSKPSISCDLVSCLFGVHYCCRGKTSSLRLHSVFEVAGCDYASTESSRHIPTISIRTAVPPPRCPSHSVSSLRSLEHGRIRRLSRLDTEAPDDGFARASALSSTTQNTQSIVSQEDSTARCLSRLRSARRPSLNRSQETRPVYWDDRGEGRLR